jgi:hypothetical protein
MSEAAKPLAASFSASVDKAGSTIWRALSRSPAPRMAGLLSSRQGGTESGSGQASKRIRFLPETKAHHWP